MITTYWRRRLVARSFVECMLVPYNAMATLSSDYPAIRSFVCTKTSAMTALQRLALVWQCVRVSTYVPCPHTQSEILAFINAVLSLPPALQGCIVEAGAYKGGSTAKFSLGARATGRRLVVFDSFEGLPDHHERHDTTIHGGQTDFRKGAYHGTLAEVQRNIRRFGCHAACDLVAGWFADTMPTFDEPVAAIYLDVDLAASTRTCLKYLYPLLEPGGFVFSQDGHLPLVIDVLNDDRFWEDEIGVARPEFQGLGCRKLVVARKPAAGL